MDTVLKVKNLEKNFRTVKKGAGFKASVRSLLRPEYKTIEAVKKISFEVQQGEILAFIGPNGAGKSTTIKLITGILYPDAGEISLLGLNPHRDRKKLAYKIGTVFGQKSQLWFHLPPLDSFMLLGAIYDMSKRETEKKIAFLTEVFELEDFLKQAVRKLSLGQRIRCEIAASLIHDPEILFLDEPSIGLDVIVKQRIRDLICRINQEQKTTIFLTSHDAGDIEKICKNAIVINNGQIVWHDSVKKMKYSLLNKRIIDLKLASPLKGDFESVNILKQGPYFAKLEIDIQEQSLEILIQKILHNNEVEDITISSTPMEEIISTIYEGGV